MGVAAGEFHAQRDTPGTMAAWRTNLLKRIDAYHRMLAAIDNLDMSSRALLARVVVKNGWQGFEPTLHFTASQIGQLLPSLADSSAPPKVPTFHPATQIIDAQLKEEPPALPMDE